MSGSAAAIAAVQVLAVAVGAPLLVGWMRQVRARLEGRAGAGVRQPWRDLRKLLRKQDVRPIGTTVVFVLAPAVVAGSALLLAAAIPVVATSSPLGSSLDLVALVGVLFLGTVATALAGLDTGTAFGGMGASRSVMVAALVEPTILMAVFALSVPARSTSLGVIVAGTVHDPGRVVSPAGFLAFVALAVVIVAETGRLPVDNPSTHLELTMLHEAMVLEYAGPRLALVEWAGGLRLTVLLTLLVNLFLPWGIATGAHPGVGALLVGLAVAAGKVAVVATLLAAGEVLLAKVRLFRVPELLAGSFVLALVAVTASYFLAAPTGRNG